MEMQKEQLVGKLKDNLNILLDASGDISTMYGAFSIPTTIILKSEGEIEQEIAGPLEKSY
ncbi:hypothetical protein LZ480_18860 [Solibacillus sp. MA9]|uniref:Uncharacterized protein n=1 Tax=Solibacillus palustris TaxID=2908203 RepID=A0ABS9UII1_9BACL|nr:hypothetical protein [Solibacillus sp. MA9]MCH7323934.1 hypothetical protein [Solibacillus sp. MA9]